MKNLQLFFLILLTLPLTSSGQYRGPADSVYLFAYSRNEGRSGLLLAWSRDEKHWHGIGLHQRFFVQ